MRKVYPRGRLGPKSGRTLENFSFECGLTFFCNRVNAFADDQWNKGQFIARPLSDRWDTKLQPILAINSSRLFLAAGNIIYTYGFGISGNALERAPDVFLEGIYSTSESTHPKTDITSLTCIPECGNDSTVFVGYANGIVEKLQLPPSKGSRQTTYVPSSAREAYEGHGDNIIESISASSTHVLSFASSGTACLRPIKLSEAKSPAEMISLNARGWSSYLSSRGHYHFAAFGTTSINPLVIHDVLPSGLSANPSILLDVPVDYMSPPAVYDITSAPVSSPWGASDQIVVSGWYDGFVRVHDLRSSNAARTASSSSTPSPSSSDTSPITSLQPTLSFDDPWSLEPIYSISCGGGSGAHIAAGSARHSVLAFWDVRYAKKGWSVHAPGGDPSPVYSVVIDGPRVFGANQSRGFVLDFGPGVREETYPAVNVNVNAATGPRVRTRRRGGAGDDDLKVLGPGFYVTTYSHARLNWTGKSL